MLAVESSELCHTEVEEKIIAVLKENMNFLTFRQIKDQGAHQHPCIDSLSAHEEQEQEGLEGGTMHPHTHRRTSQKLLLYWTPIM